MHSEVAKVKKLCGLLLFCIALAGCNDHDLCPRNPGPPVSVPEPSSFLLCGIGVLGILGRKYARGKTGSAKDAG